MATRAFANVFVIQTPYHMILSVLEANPAEAQHFILLGPLPSQWQRYEIFLRETYGDESTTYLPSWAHSLFTKFSFGRIGHAGRSYRRLGGELVGQVERLVVFNDSDVEVQALASKLKPKSVDHFEDGSFFYVDYFLQRSPLKEFLKKIISLGAYDSKSLPGQTKWVAERYALKPDRVRSELRPVNALQVSDVGIRRLVALASHVGIEPYDRPTAVVTIPLESISEKETAWYRDQIDELRAQGLRVLAKERPRKIRSSHLVALTDGVVESFLPLELLAIVNPNLKAVVGAANTTSLVLEKFVHGVNIRALLKGIWDHDPRAKETLEILNVEITHSSKL